MTDRLDERAIQKASGPAWEPLKDTFLDLSKRLLAVSPEAKAELTTIYVKYCRTTAATEVYAVAWLKTSKQIVVGMTLPESIDHPRLGDPRPGMKYKGLTNWTAPLCGLSRL